MQRGGGPRAWGLVRVGVVPTWSLERAWREMSHLLVMWFRPGSLFGIFGLWGVLASLFLQS